MNFVLIETPRLILKGLSPEVMKSVFEKHSKPEIKKILGHRSEEDYLREEKKQKHGYSTYNRSFLLFLIADKTSGLIIGRCGIHNWNAEHRRAEVGYVMEDENYKRKGLMSEALEAVIEYGFTQLDLNRMEALVSVENVPSLRLMEKFNFTKEGVLKQHYYSAGKFDDSIIFSRLSEDFRKDQ